jgi:hypothetical protein
VAKFATRSVSDFLDENEWFSRANLEVEVPQEVDPPKAVDPVPEISDDYAMWKCESERRDFRAHDVTALIGSGST